MSDPVVQVGGARPKSICCCVQCGEPLIGTFEVRMKEWYCMICETYFEFLRVRWEDPTDERWARYLHLKEPFLMGVRSLPKEDTDAVQ